MQLPNRHDWYTATDADAPQPRASRSAFTRNPYRKSRQVDASGLRGYPFIFFQEDWGSQLVIQESLTETVLSLCGLCSGRDN